MSHAGQPTSTTTQHPADTATPTRMTAMQVVQFFVVLPVAVGLFLGAAEIGPYSFDSIGYQLAYQCQYSVVSWACYGAGALVMARVLRPWEPSLLVVLLAGNILGGFTLLWPLRDLINGFFEPHLLSGSSFGAFWPPPADGVGRYIAITVQGVAWWLLANWADFAWRRVPRFGFSPPGRPRGAAKPQPEVDTASSVEPVPTGAAAGDSASPATRDTVAEPALKARLPDHLRDGEIRALKAEEHYTKVFTSAGTALLLLRFADAIEEMKPQQGLQVHRSYWASLNAVERLDRSKGNWTLRLRGDLKVPVSRSYRVLVKSAGLAAETRPPG